MRTRQILGLGGLCSVALTCSLVAAPVQAVISGVDEASDVCAPAVDPCVIDDTVEIVDGATLDFGTRTVEVTANGTLDGGIGDVSVLCGSFLARPSASVAIKARGPSPFGGTDGGAFSVEARRACSLDASRACLHALDCSVGPCIANRCARDAAVACNADGDCALGSCSVGEGTLTLMAGARADGNEPGEISLSAAGELLAAASIDAGSTNADADGGSVTLTSFGDSVVVTAGISVRGGRLSTGGDVVIEAADDIVIDASIDADGGDFDGGTVEIVAGRDAIVRAPVRLSSVAGEGAGGDLTIDAGRDLRLLAGAVVRADGHRAGSSAGDGGALDLVAGRDLDLADGASVVANGASPEGFGGDLTLAAGRHARIAGRIEAAGTGIDGAAGTVEIAGCRVTLDATAQVETAGEGGDNTLTGRERVVLAPGSRLLADAASGSNTLRYRRANAPPIVGGTVVPAATLALVETLARCEPCGNGDLAPGEPCDDEIACTTDDRCMDGVCSGIPDCPLGQACNTMTGDCEGGTTTTVVMTTTTMLDSSTTTLGGCGDGVVVAPEQCDDGPAPWVIGAPCRDDCTLLVCGDPDDSGRITATDALIALRAAAGTTACPPCICDVDARGTVNASDALRLLRLAVGAPLEIACPPC